MISLKSSTIRIQVSKDIIQEVLDGKRFHLELIASKHWKKELLDIKLIDNQLIKSLKEIETIVICNGLHPDLPIYKYNCIRYFLDEKNNNFIFQLGESLEDEQSSSANNKIKSVKQLNLFD